MSDVLDLRCDHALHGRLDPVTLVLSVKCRKCTGHAGYAIFHRWPLLDLVERYLRGDLSGVCAPADERFVYWRVSAV